MAVKDIVDYYNKVTSHYIEMKEVLKELESNIPEDKIENANNNISMIRKDVEQLASNYRRISYIMYLLNKPTKKEKHKRYEQSETKRLSEISEENSLEGIVKEDNDILKRLNSYL